MNAMKKKIAVKVVSDTICPWCYIGKKRLESAIQSFTASSSASVEFEVRHVPYLLLPQLPKEGLDKRAFYRKRVGEERYGVMVRSLQELGKSLNIKFKEDGTIGNTVLSHRLLEYAHRKGKQQETLEQVYKIYFEEGQNLASKDVLLAAAERAGLERTPTEQFLDGEEDLDFVLMLDRELKDNRGVHGVPHFIFNDKYAFGGAQEEAVFTSVFQKVLKDQRQTATQSKPSTEEALKPSKL
ncbi:DsbA family oxidoreductase [Balamuthia mandrillaris]